MIREKGLKIPEDEEQSFFLLAKENFITLDLAKKLKDAKGMRNIIAHEYGKLDDALVFYAVTEELERDAREFLEQIKKFLLKF